MTSWLNEGLTGKGDGTGRAAIEDEWAGYGFGQAVDCGEAWQDDEGSYGEGCGCQHPAGDGLGDGDGDGDFIRKNHGSGWGCGSGFEEGFGCDHGIEWLVQKGFIK